MKRMKNTKRALLLSALSLLMCVSMLVGSTFAWFTDSVTSGSNIIKSGKLEIALLDAAGASLEGEMIEWAAKDGRPQDQILWEPGCTYNTEEFYIKNTGNLNLKFRFAVTGIDGDAKLLEVIDFSVMADASQMNFNTGAVSVNTSGTFDLLKGYTVDTFFYGEQTFTEYVLKPDQVVGPLVLNGHMDENANNDYQNLTIEGIAVSLIATQATGEEDSFNGVYDADALYSGFGSGKLEDPSQSAIEIPITNGANENLGSATIPADALADPNAETEAKILPSSYVGNFTVADGLSVKAYEISVSNLKENNTVPVKVQVRLEPGKDPSTVKLYHYSEEIHCTYDPSTGFVTFETTSFSPFSLVYDANSVYVPTDPEGNDLPVAVVTTNPEFVNVDLPWGAYGQWSPTAGLDSKLEAAYTFTCQDTPAESELSEYANWYCDFYVKLDKDLGANQIFLGGNYGAFGWVGFHNGELTLAANNEIPLLGSVAGNPWTYSQVASNVGTFICGVGDVNDALSGATFTVMLRLTNPEDETEFYNVKTIEYKFEEPQKVDTQENLTSAITAGATAVELGTGAYQMPDGSDLSLRDKELTISGTKDTVIDASNVDARDQFVTGANVVFDGVTLNFGKVNYMGFANTESLTFRNCTINGLQFLYGKSVKFVNCDLNSNGAEHCVWTYGAENVSFTDCDFTYGDRGINCYSDNDVPSGKQVVNFNNCTFTTDNTASEGAVEINSCYFSVGIEVNMEDCTAPNYGEMAYVSPWDSTNGAKTTINIK